MADAADGIFIVAGEVSGDVHGAELLSALKKEKPNVRVRGLGGPAMQKIAGPDIDDWLDFAAVMGVWEVLKHYKAFKKRMLDTVAAIEADPPKVLLLIDYPGFNLRLAERVEAVAPQTHIVQYVCPQVWAWKKGRIPKIARVIDTLICLFPFEPALFPKDEVDAICLGHPVIDELSELRESSGKIDREKGLVALLPGSREREIERIFPTMLETALRLAESEASVRFAVPAATPALGARLREMIEKDAGELEISITEGKSHELMQRAWCGIVTSGTATLEAAFFGLPHCIVYKLAWTTYAIARVVVKIEHIGIVNVLADERVVNEYVQSEAEPVQLKAEMENFLRSEQECKRLQTRMSGVVATLGGTGVHERIAARLRALL